MRRVIAARPCSNNPTSPRNLLTMKPWIRASSSGSRTRCVPARLAMTPPRSISPSITTGTLAAAANPMLAISPARRLISAGLPAPSTRTISASRGEVSKTLQHRRQQGRLLVQIVLGTQRAPALALHDDLRAGVGLRLQQHRVHVHAGRHPRRPRLHGLGAADLAALDRHGGIVRHVLRLERRHLQTAPHQRTGKPRDDRRLAGVGAGGLDHQRGRRPLHQNSMPFWPFTPARNGCFTSVISVTRSAISISSGLALRPVMTTCLSAGFSSRRKVSTSLRSR